MIALLGGVILDVGPCLSWLSTLLSSPFLPIRFPKASFFYIISFYMHICEFIILKNLCGKKKPSQVVMFCTISAILAVWILHVFMDVQEQESLSQTLLCPLNWAVLELRENIPSAYIKPSLWTHQEDSYKDHSQIENNQSLKYKHIYWVTEIKLPTKYVFINCFYTQTNLSSSGSQS